MIARKAYSTTLLTGKTTHGFDEVWRNILLTKDSRGNCLISCLNEQVKPSYLKKRFSNKIFGNTYKLIYKECKQILNWI